MKIGYQTIIWGERLSHLDAVLDAIANAGYAGVELAQRPDMLGGSHQPVSFSDLTAALEQRRISLVGLANGTLEERMAYCDWQPGPYYLYIDKWDPISAMGAMDRGFSLALHVHAFMPISRLADAALLLKGHENLKWLPDTGHLRVVGEDVIAAMHLAPTDRIAAIHLKDWTPAYGRSTHRYSRGFTDLGRGIVPLRLILRELALMRYNGWLIVEQDYTNSDPFTAMFNSAIWLYENGVLSKRPTRSRAPRPVAGGPLSSTCLPVEARAISHLAGAGIQDTERAYQSIAAAYEALIPSKLVTIWTPCLAHGVLSLQMAYPAVPMRVSTLPPSQSLSGVALERHAVTVFDLSSSEPGKPYGRPHARSFVDDLIPTLGLTQMISVPVFDTCNKNHVRMVVDLYPQCPEAPVPLASLSRVSDIVSGLGDLILDRKCLDAISGATALAANAKSISAFATETCKLLRNTIHCEGVTLFMVNGPGDRLEALGTTGIQWLFDPLEPFYRLGQGITGKVWQTGKTRMSADALSEPDRTGKSTEVISSDPHSCLFVPILNSEEAVVGVLRCQNKHIDAIAGPVNFSDDDVAVVEAIGEAVRSHLTVSISESHRRGAVERLAHELQRPAGAVSGAVDLMRSDLRRKGIRPESAFAFDYLGDIAGWSELMMGLIENADFYGKRGDTLVLDPVPTLLMADIVAPAVRQISMLLKARKLPPDRIEYGRFSEIPMLLVDPGKMQQVMFNLLANAIKYAFSDPRAFRIAIDGHRWSGEFRIDISDWGEGIPAGFEEKIFEEGFRAPRSGGRPVSGQGFGLYIVRLIINAHGGHVKVSKRHLPTVISIYLPETLACDKAGAP